MNFDIKMNVRKSIIPNPVYIDGLSRSGKAAVGVSLASLDRTEHILTRNIIDRIFTLYSLGLLDKNAALDNIITEANFKLWFSYLGRNLNTNIHDFTSVLNSRDYGMYKTRMERQDNEKTFNEFLSFLKNEKPITLDCVDEMLYESDLFFEAFPNLYIVAVLRHPVDIAFGWQRTGRGYKYGKDSRTIHPTLIVNEKFQVPVFAKEWADEYVAMKPIDRVIKVITMLTNKYYDYIENIPDSKAGSIYVIPFEHFVTNPHEFLEEICKRLSTSYTLATPKMLEKANLPRSLNQKNFARKFYGLKKYASPNLFEEFDETCQKYEKLFNCPLQISKTTIEKGYEYSSDFNLYFSNPFYKSGKRIE